MNFVVRLSLMPYLLDDPGDGGGGGGDAQGGSGSSGADNGGKPQSDAGDGQAKPASDGKPAAKPAEDPRLKGMLADLAKERKARQAAEAERDARRAELDQERRRVQALAGVNPKTKDQEDEELIRQRMAQLYPHLGEMTSEDLKALREMKTLREEMRAATSHTWKSHGEKMLRSVRDGFQTAMGGTLSDRQVARIESAYIEEAKSNPEFLARHEQGDPTLVDEFVKGFIEDFVEPGRRSALAAEVNRARRVPDGKGRSINHAGDKKIDVNDPKAVEDFLVKSYRERGGSFKR